ncbi:MAG: AAA family ATPase, partial [Candidatus Hydrogenedentota bacterium]
MTISLRCDPTTVSLSAMYTEYYGLTEKPFNLTPDPRYLFLSRKHKEAFAHLMYGIRHRSGFVMVSGEIGTGKTTICRSLLKQLDPNIEVALIFNPYLSPQELLKCINRDFGIESESATILELIDELNEYLLLCASEGKNCVLIIDEAQDLSAEILEQIRLLSNLETEKEKLLQIMLIGQPELARKLELNELRQLNQRITARYHLEALGEEETLQYVAFRLRVAGGRKKVRFTRKAIRVIYEISQGTPRVINALCDRSLLIGYTREIREITPKIVKLAAKEIQGNEHIRIRSLDIASILRTAGVLSFAAVVVLLIVLATSGPIGISTLQRSVDSEPVDESPPTERTLNAGSQVDAISNSVEIPDSDSEEVLAQLERNLEEVVSEPNVDGMVVGDAPEPETAEETLLVDDALPVEPNVEITDLPELEAAVVSPSVNLSAEEIPDVTETSEEEVQPDEIVVARIPESVQQAVPKRVETVRLSAALEREALHTALRGLLEAWDVTVTADYPVTTRYQAIVEFAVAHGFGSNRIEPSLAQLVALNYPAMIEVDFGEGVHWATLIGVEDFDAFILSHADEMRVLSLAELNDVYRNSAVVLWMDESMSQEPLRPLDQGEDVWVLQYKLSKIGALTTEPNGVYDDAT